MRPDRDRLLDMIEACDLLLEHSADPAQLATDPVVQAAAERWIEIMGEAASNLSDEVKQAHPAIPWREIVGARVVLAHAYFRVDAAIVANVVDELPDLRRRLQTIVDETGDR